MTVFGPEDNPFCAGLVVNKHLLSMGTYSHCVLHVLDLYMYFFNR